MQQNMLMCCPISYASNQNTQWSDDQKRRFILFLIYRFGQIYKAKTLVLRDRVIHLLAQFVQTRDPQQCRHRLRMHLHQKMKRNHDIERLTVKWLLSCKLFKGWTLNEIKEAIVDQFRRLKIVNFTLRAYLRRLEKNFKKFTEIYNEQVILRNKRKQQNLIKEQEKESNDDVSQLNLDVKLQGQNIQIVKKEQLQKDQQSQQKQDEHKNSVMNKKIKTKK